MVTTSNLDTLPSWASELLRDAPVGHLGLLVGDELWSAIDDKPKRRPGDELARVRWLRARPNSALTVHRYDADWSRLAWVQVLGSTAVVDAAGQDRALDALAARYPAYREQRPAGPLLRLTPERVIHWRATDSPGPA